MPRFAAAATPLALLLSSTAALADVTSDEVWADLRALMEGSGQTVTVGSEDRSGNTLTVRDIVIDMSMADATSSASLDQIAFVERGDGTVEIVLSPEYRIVSSSTVDGETVEVRAAMTHSALSLVVSGDATEKTYTYSAASVGFELSELAAQGATVPVTMNLEVANPSGNYVSRMEDGGRALDSTFVANAMHIDMSGSDATTGNFDFTMKLDNLAGGSEAFLPEGGEFADLAAFLNQGFSASGQMTYGATNYSFKGDIEGSHSEGSGGDSGGAFDFALSGDGLNYGAESRDASFTMRSTDIPLPEVAFGYEQGAFRLTMPVTASEGPQDFRLLTALRGLTVSDGVWALFDPMASLPRDPATVAIDVSGKARWFIDIFNPEAAASGAPPGELEELTIRNLEVSLVGAELTGSGDFTFDNTDMTTFDGMPKPEGSADLKLVGGNALLDKLVAMGFVPEDQATGFRMMLGLFARPGEGEDTLVSKIEVNGEGQVLANGQRLK
jgi:hypothetical protein